MASNTVVKRRRHSPDGNRPNMSELRIVVLGKNVPETSKVGNFILGRDAFETEAPPPSVEQHSERARGQVEGRYITLIHTPHLFNTELSQEELNQRVKECVTLSAPGPHVIALIIQPDSFMKEDKNQVYNIFKCLSEDVDKHSLVITLNIECGTSVDRSPQNIMLEIIAQFSHRHFEFSSGSCCSALVEMMMEIFKENRGKHVIWQEYKETLEQEYILPEQEIGQQKYGISSEQETCRAQEKNYEASTKQCENTTELVEKNTRELEEYDTKEQQACKESVMKKGINYIMNSFRASKPKLNLVLFGREPGVKTFISNLLLGKKSLKFEKSLASSSVCIRKDGEVCGHLITLVEMPALYNTQLSEEEVMRETLHCVSLCDPGVHAFLFTIPVGPLSDKDKGEVEMIQRIFSSEIQNYSMFFITGDSHGSQLSKSVSTVIKASGGRYNFCSSKTTSQELITCVEKLLKENGNLYYTSAMYHSAQAETQLQCKQKIIDLQRQITDLMKRKRSPPQESASTLPPLNLVLCGRDGALKASISDLILGQREQSPEPTSVCVWREGEVCGHPLTLVEMPALYNTQLSEEKVMHETLRCVSMCDPGVHAFLFIVPEDQFTDEDKLEMDKIQKIFSPRVCNHSIVLFTQQSREEHLDHSVQTMIEACAETYKFISTKTPDQEVITCVKDLIKKNGNCQYTTTIYFDAQIETQLQYMKENKKLKQQITELKMRNWNQTQESSTNSDTLRIVLLGKTGVGKSATGNTILGKDVFKEDFGESVSKMCQKEMAEINGRRLTVTDTPGLFDTSIPNVEITKEITKCISMAAPGPHIFLLVLKAMERFTQEERDTVRMIKATFGEKSKMYTIVLFTRGDQLKGKSIEQYIEKSGKDLKNVLHEFGNRYHVVDNNNKTSSNQVTALLDKIDSLVAVNKGSCYTNEMFKQVEKEIQADQQRILKEREKQIEREKEELKTKYEAEMEKMRKEIKEEKLRQDAENQMREERFKEREQDIKKEMREREQKQTEDFKKRREEDDLRINAWMEQINKEREDNRKQWEKQRAQEEEDRKRRDQEWKEKQKQDEERFEQEKADLKKNEKEEVKKLQQEYEQKKTEVEKKRAELEDQLRHAEESKKKELHELQQVQQREWERRMKEVKDKTEKQQKFWENKIMSMEKNWNLQQIRNQKKFDWERQREIEQREEEKKRIEDETNEKIREMEEKLKAQREKDEKERKEKDEQHRKEMENELQKHQEDFRKERETAEKIHSEAEKRNLEFIKETHAKEMEKLKKDTEQSARKQAEEEFCARLDEKVKEAKEKGFEEGRADVESERTRPGRNVDQFVNWVCGSNKDEGKIKKQK